MATNIENHVVFFHGITWQRIDFQNCPTKQCQRDKCLRLLLCVILTILPTSFLYFCCKQDFPRPKKNSQCCPETQHCFEEQVVDLNPPSQTRRPWQSKPNAAQWTWLSCTPYIQTSFVGLTRTSPSSIEHLQKDTGKDHTFGDLIRKTVWCDPLSSEDLKMTFQFFQINQIKISFRWWPCIFNDSTVAIQRYIIIFCVTSWPFSCFAKHVIKN